MQLKHTILYAEDDFDDLLMVQQAFQKHDHIRIVHATNGERALSALENMTADGVWPCLIILDINMPLMNGRETLKTIRLHPRFNHLPVVLFSTSNSDADKQFAQNLNAVLITKPISFSDLEGVAETFIQRCNVEIGKPTIH